jgi:hypothetical protein
MKREEEIKEAAKEYDLWSIGQQLFIVGAQWADEHPRKGLWDKEKVIGWLKEHITFENHGLVEELCKAMEEG